MRQARTRAARKKRRAVSVTIAVAILAMVGGVALAVNQLGSDDQTVTAAPPTSAPEDFSTPTPTPTAEPTPEPTVEPTPEPAALMSLGDSGDQVRELQARLKQIQWYEPDVTGEFDDITFQSVQGFQAKREIEVTGEVDEETWDRLLAMTVQPTDDELHNRIVAGPTIIGPDDSGDRVRELQARLKQIGWFEQDVTGTYGPVTSTAVAGFQTKRGIPDTGEVDQKTWDLLVGMTRTPTDDELHNRRPEPEPDDDAPKSDLPKECRAGRVLCVDKTTRSLKWVIDGKVKMTLDARFGSDETPTREGLHSVYWKNRDHVSSITGTEMPYAMFFDHGQAVHYSQHFADNGYDGASLGCVNIRDKGAISTLFDQVRVGDKVFIHRS
jgi:peptidoglycan hydrolase-like protein with peptidoglycan-binding domain